MSVKYTGIPETFEDDARLLTNVALIEKYGVSDRTITRWRQAVKVPALHVIGASSRGGLPTTYSFPDPDVFSYRNLGLLKIEGDCIVTSDWHCPYHDLGLAERMVKLARTLGIRQLAIVGDLFDAATLSHFDPRGDLFSVKDELATVVHLIDHLYRYFDRIYWCGGNHEARLFRTLKFQVELPDLANLLSDNEKLVTTERDLMMLESGDQVYRLTHPRSYSQASCAVAVKLAEKYDQHVMSAHGHFIGWRVSRNGKYLGIDLGGMFDVDKVVYINVGGETTHPRWNGGFWVVRNGSAVPYSLSVPVCDWSIIDERPVLRVIKAA